MKLSFREDGKRLIVISIAALLMALNLNTFVHTGGLYPGGVTGLTVLLIRVFSVYFGVNLPYSVVNILLNAIPVYIGFRFIGKKLTLYTLYLILLSGFLTDIIPSHAITSDLLLISIFGGIISGVVVSLCLLSNANTGGTDFIALFISQKTGTDSFNIMLGVNVVLLTTAGLLFGWDKALYSILYQYVSTQVVHLLYRRYQSTTLFIVTNKAQEICHAISEVSHHGATILHGEGSYSNSEHAFVYSVVSSAEIRTVLKSVKETDPDAFINLIRTEQLSGQFYRPPTE
ncbi:MAG: YitT family protein [Lachnospiraceae bacterium]|nr:YitT family protein [Lachnospiraceae bacterium]